MQCKSEERNMYLMTALKIFNREIWAVINFF